MLGTACGGGKVPRSIEVPPPPPSAPPLLQSGVEQTPDGLVLRGETRLVGPAADTIETAVTLTNPSPARVRVRVGSCALRVRAHTTQRLWDRPLWDSRRNPTALEDEACRAPERWLELPPGGSASPDELRLRIPVRELVGNARFFSAVHYFAATVLINGRSIEIPAGELGLPYVPRTVETVEGLTFRAETRVVEGRPVRLRTQVTITNRNSYWVRLEYGDCSPDLRAYRHVNRSGKPVWEQRLLPARDPKTGMYVPGCDLYGSLAVIPAGESYVVKRFQLEPTIHEVLGDSLPEGRYFFTAVFRPTIRQSVIPELPSGSVVLTR